MPDQSIVLEVVTPESLLLSTSIDSLVAPASEGYLGVLPGHAPLVASLAAGVLRYKSGGRTGKIALSGGFMEVAANRVVVLADTAEQAEAINVARAERARERAEKRLKDRQAGTDVARAEMALKKALARLEATQ